MLLIRKDSLILFFVFFLRLFWLWLRIWLGTVFFSTVYADGVFQTENGMRINTYGDYDKDGWRVPNRSAMPWERNNFRGAFELKSANGNFGIRIEVQQGRNAPY